MGCVSELENLRVPKSLPPDLLTQRNHPPQFGLQRGFEGAYRGAPGSSRTAFLFFLLQFFFFFFVIYGVKNPYLLFKEQSLLSQLLLALAEDENEVLKSQERK